MSDKEKPRIDYITPNDYFATGHISKIPRNEHGVFFTRIELIEALDALPDIGEILLELQKLQPAKKKEQYEKILPAGFEFAPESAKEYRTTLESIKNEKQMEYLKSIVSYNADGTMNFIPLHKTFCKDISGEGALMNYENALLLAEEKEYDIIKDYNDVDGRKKATKFYKTINLLNPYGEKKGDTTEARAIFRDMTGCDGKYWTKTTYALSEYCISDDLVCVRNFQKDNLDRGLSNIKDKNLVCGFKDME